MLAGSSSGPRALRAWAQWATRAHQHTRGDAVACWRASQACRIHVLAEAADGARPSAAPGAAASIRQSTRNSNRSIRRKRLGKKTTDAEPLRQSQAATGSDVAELMPRQPYDYYCVLDFEATCEEGRRNGPTYRAEVIELPTVLLDGRTMEVVDEFQCYVKPVINPTLTAFCTDLTGIEQKQIDGSPPFTDALRQHTAWLQKHGLAVGGAGAGHSWAFVTCGDWDLKTMLPEQFRWLQEGGSANASSASSGSSRLRMPDHFRHW